MSDDAERERARYEALAALVDNYRRERDDAREQLYMTKAEIGRWVDRETKAARERDKARELYEDCLICNRNLFGIINDRTEERDEARAEVGRLWEMAHDFEAMRKDRDSAYRRGAEAMREACVNVVLTELSDPWYSDELLQPMRALPIPEDK